MQSGFAMQERQKLSSSEQRPLGVALASSLKLYSGCPYHFLPAVLHRMTMYMICVLKLLEHRAYLLPKLGVTSAVLCDNSGQCVLLSCCLH